MKKTINLKNITTTIAVLSLSACSVFIPEDQKLFSIEDSKATHQAEVLMGDSITIITPKDAKLEDHLVLGSRAYVMTNESGYVKRITNLTKTSEKDGSFSFTKTKCAKQAAKPYLYEKEYIDQVTLCLMEEGNDFPIDGLVVSYEGTYSLEKNKNNDKHTIIINKAESIHSVFPNIFSGIIITNKDERATEGNFYNLFRRYIDDEQIIKFKDYSPVELESAVKRSIRFLTQNEYSYVKRTNALSKRGQVQYDNKYTIKDLESEDGLITFMYTVEPYKLGGSILTILPTYYPSASEIQNSENVKIDFSAKRNKLLRSLKTILNE